MTPLETLQAALGDRYKFEREIGAGGMATVYLARDLRHDRQVAVKVLKPELGAVLGAERFLSEIKVTANLQHPNLLPLFDSGEAGGLLFYVMPFVEGETLRELLDREKQLPVDDAVHISVATASALQYAHAHGVIHRDLKPENIFIHSGQPIIADFGIALAVSKAGGARVTQTGLSLGTPQYMSPEQASGDRVIDARSDIYSLGAVAYEMLGGEPPHTGSSGQAIIAKLMTTEPQPLQTLRPRIPVNVACAVEKALAKLPADRFASAQDFAASLQNPHFTITKRSSIAEAPGATRAAVRKWKLATIAASALAALLLLAALWAWLKPEPPRPVVRNVIPLDSTQTLNAARYGRIALSPDGSTIVFAGGPGSKLFVRRRDELDATEIPGTEGALSPFFSPDGKQIGFATLAYSLEVVSLAGGPPVTITDSLVSRGGGSWGADGMIYVPDRTGIARIAPVPGSNPVSIIAMDTANGEVIQSLPEALPNGKGVVFVVTFGGKGRRGIAIAAGDISTGKHTILAPGIAARYSPSGHLLYVTQDGTLMSCPFDQNKLRVTGEPVAIAHGLAMGIGEATDLGVSRNGTLIYISGGADEKKELAWIGRHGKADTADSAWQGYFDGPAISPDGQSVALSAEAAGRQDIWVTQLGKVTPLKLTFEGNPNLNPAWTSDGRSITYYSVSRWAQKDKPTFDLWTRRADGTGPPLVQLHQKRSLSEALWSHDGKWLIYRTSISDKGTGDIYAIRPGVDSTPVALAESPAGEYSPAISPDDRWLAYASNESSKEEVYVVPFPYAGSAKWSVSTRGGSEPVWSHHGNELFYRDGAGNMVAAQVTTKPTFSVGPTKVLFQATRYASSPVHRQYDVSRDDTRFLMLRPLLSTSSGKLIVVDSWLTDLRSTARR